MKPFALHSSLIIFVPLILSLLFFTFMPKETAMTTLEVFGVKIEKNPSKSKLAELGVSSWSKYIHYFPNFPIKIPWSFEEEETMYILEGKVKVSVEGSIGSFEIGGGDLAVFPKGMNITWEVIEPLKKHYSVKK